MLPDNPIKLTPLQALAKIEAWCAYQERCQQEVRDKLYSYGLWTEDVENLISQLISNNFVNEERFARAFAGGKFRIKKWGRIKIKSELKAKRISDYCIKKALSEINDIDYVNTLKKIIQQKSKLVKESSKIKKTYKLIRYAASKGYEQDIIMQILKDDAIDE